MRDNGSKIMVFLPHGISRLDTNIVEHYVDEVKSLAGEMLCDFDEFGSGGFYDVEIVFSVRDVKNNGR